MALYSHRRVGACPRIINNYCRQLFPLVHKGIIILPVGQHVDYAALHT